MTLVLSLQSRDSLWVVVDRRLSYGGHRRPVDDAVKIVGLETIDGVGVLAYAGLGATPRGTQPSDWMSAVLRGRSGLTFDQALGFLSAVANRELPRYLARIPGGGHFIVVPAFVRGVGARLYSGHVALPRKTRGPARVPTGLLARRPLVPGGEARRPKAVGVRFNVEATPVAVRCET